MPLSPIEVADQSPKAKLTDAEAATLEKVYAAIDEHLVTHWEMAARKVPIVEPLTLCQLGHLVRAYQSVGWDVQLKAANSMVAGVKEVLDRGGAVGWEVVLIPSWNNVKALARAAQQDAA